MSSSKLWQICHKNNQGNKLLTKQLVEAIRRRSMPPKEISRGLAVPTGRVRNWYYRNTGMTALDLLLLMGEYDFIKDFIEKAVVAYGAYRKGQDRS